MASKKKSKKGLYTLVTLILLILMLVFMFLNENGLRKYFQLKGNLSELNQEIADAENQIENLKAEVDSLQNSLIKIEQVAREQYMMLKANEKVLEIESSK